MNVEVDDPSVARLVVFEALLGDKQVALAETARARDLASADAAQYKRALQQAEETKAMALADAARYQNAFEQAVEERHARDMKVESLNSELCNAKHALFNAQQEYESVKRTLVDTEGALAAERGVATIMRASLHAKDAELAEKDSRLVEQDAELVALAAKDTELTDTANKFAVAQDMITHLQRDLGASTVARESLEKALEETTRMWQDEKARAEEGEACVDALENNAVKLHAELAVLGDDVEGMKTMLCESEAGRRAGEERLHAIERELKGVKAELGEFAGQNSRLVARLTTSAAVETGLREELVQARAEAERLAVAKARDEAAFCKIRDAWARMRQAEMEGRNMFEEEVGSIFESYIKYSP